MGISTSIVVGRDLRHILHNGRVFYRYVLSYSRLFRDWPVNSTEGGRANYDKNTGYPKSLATLSYASSDTHNLFIEIEVVEVVLEYCNFMNGLNETKIIRYVKLFTCYPP